MKSIRFLSILALLASTLSMADTPPARTTNSELYDASGNGITSTVDGTKRGLDVHQTNLTSDPGMDSVVYGGAVVDPRAVRALTTADQISCQQLGPWTAGRTWTLSEGTDSIASWLADGAGTPITSSLVAGHQAIDVNAVGVTTATVADETASGTLTAACASPSSCPAGSTVALNINGISGVKAEITGTWVGTIFFEFSVDSSLTWHTAGTFSGTTGAVLSGTGLSANDTVVLVGIAGAAHVRARATAWTSGTASVVIESSNGVSNVFVDNLIPQNLKMQAFGSSTALPFQQDASGNLFSAQVGNWFTRLQDGAGTNLTSTLVGAKQSLDVNPSALGPDAATATNQIAGNSSLTSIATNTSTTASNTAGIGSTLTTIDSDLKAAQPRKMQDGAGNNLTSQISGAQRALDIGIDVGGTQVDPRTRSWTLSDLTDSCSASQKGAWTTGRTWTLASGTDSVSSVQSGTWSTRMQDAAGTGITSTLVGAKQSADVNVTQSALPTGAATAGNQTTIDTDLNSFKAANHTDMTAAEPRKMQDGAGNNLTSTLNSTKQSLDVNPTALEPGAATAANQTTLDTDLNSFKTANHTDLGTNTTAINSFASANHTDMTASEPRKLQDGAGNNLTSTLNSTKQSLDVNPTALEPGAATAANQTTLDTDLNSFKTANHTDVGTNTTAVNTFATANHADLIAAEPRKLQDGSGNPITSTAANSKQHLDVASTEYGTVTLTPPSAAANGARVPRPTDARGASFVGTSNELSTLWGMSFNATTDTVTIVTNNTETPFAYVTNPSASGKTLKIYLISFGAPSTGSVVYRTYVNPTVTANGTALTIIGGRVTGQNASVASAFKSPTVSANGTLLSVHRQNLNQDLLVIRDYDLFIEPGGSMLVTATVNTNNTAIHLDAEWKEE